MQKATVFFHKCNYTIFRIPRKELHTCTPINVIDASYTTEKLYANESRKSCSGVTSQPGGGLDILRLGALCHA